MTGWRGWTVEALRQHVDQRLSRIEKDASEHHAEDRETFVTRELYDARHREIETALSILREENLQRRDFVDSELQALREENLAARERLAGAEQAADRGRVTRAQLFTAGGFAVAFASLIAFLAAYHLP